MLDPTRHFQLGEEDKRLIGRFGSRKIIISRTPILILLYIKLPIMNNYLNKNTPPKSRTTRNCATHITNIAQSCLQKGKGFTFVALSAVI